MYRIVKVKKNLVAVIGISDPPYFSGQIPRNDWINGIEETYLGEKTDLAKITDAWIPICRGNYQHVKETLESWSHSE